MPSENVAVVVVLENQGFGRDDAEKELGALGLVQLFEMRFTVIAGIHSAELHLASKRWHCFPLTSNPKAIARRVRG
jgi:hypothetical protein